MVTEIFATRSDLIPGIEWIEGQKGLKYVEAGLYNKDEINEITVLDSLRDVKEIGYNTSGQYISGIAFLVIDRRYKIKIEKVKQRKGGYLYDVGPLKNPHSIVFQPNGMYQDRYLIKGTIGTVSESKKSIELYKLFSKGIVRGFTKTKGLYIGPEAMELYKSGIRLITMHIKQSPEYDLSIEHFVIGGK